MLHDYLIEQDFKQSLNDMCMYTKQTHDCYVILLMWGDDIIIAAIVKMYCKMRSKH